MKNKSLQLKIWMPQTVADRKVHLRIDDKETKEYTSDADGFYRLDFYIE